MGYKVTESFNDMDALSVNGGHEPSNSDIQDEPGSSLDSANIFIIDRFPKEFQRNFLDSINLRFYIILFITSILAITLVNIFKNRVPEQYDSRTITKIQQQYVDLLLKRDPEFPPPSEYLEVESFDSPIDYETITGLSKWMEGIADAAMGEIMDFQAIEMEEEIVESPQFVETRGPSREDMTAARESAAETRVQSRTEMEESVGRTGVLRMITGKETTLSQEEKDYIEDLLQYADANSAQFTEILSKLNSIRVRRAGDPRRVEGLGEGMGASGKSVVGGRKNVDNELRAFLTSIDRIEKAESKNTKRRTEYEDIHTSSNMVMHPENLPTNREVKDVIDVVRGHLAAIQYCYKMELKRDPSIKGKVIVRFIVNPDGHVIDASIVSTSLNNQRVEKCILDKILKWKDFLPIKASSGNMTYKQSFKLGV